VESLKPWQWIIDVLWPSYFPDSVGKRG